MNSEPLPSIGILSLERGVTNAPLPKIVPGSFRHSETFDVPVIFETVEGAWVDNVVKGDPALEQPYIAAARRLQQRGAIAISSNCGFSIRHQDAVSASVDIPVGMSSLLLLPMLLRTLPRSAKIAVLTYDSTHCGEDLLGLSDPDDGKRVLVGGIEGGVFWHNEMMRPPPPTEPASIIEDVVACAKRMRSEHPEIATFLLECAGFPIAAFELRRREKLPVYDITDLCRLLIASVR